MQNTSILNIIHIIHNFAFFSESGAKNSMYNRKMKKKKDRKLWQSNRKLKSRNKRRLKIGGKKNLINGTRGRLTNAVDKEQLNLADIPLYRTLQIIECCKLK